MPYKDKARKAWRAVIKTKDGKRLTRLLPTKKQAMEWERKTLMKLEKSEEPQQNGTDLLSLCTKYLDYSTRFSTKVYQEKRSVCERFLEYIGSDIDVELITSEQVESYLDDQRRNRSANAANKDRRNLLAMWNKGCKTYGVIKNPVESTEKFSHDRIPPYIPSMTDVLKLLAAATRRERIFLDCYLQTGARRSEIFRMLWEDVNFEMRTVRIGTRKTRDGSMKYRALDMSDELYESLWYWWNNRKFKESPYVFVNDIGPHAGKPYTRRHNFMRGMCKRAGIRPFGFHGLRRFVASVLCSKNTPLRNIQLVLGHSRPTTTDMYIGDIHKGLRETMNKLSLKEDTQTNTQSKKG